ncbi:MAG TPA: ATP-binding cassette domain-containing protein [Fibrobacteria bacterium]|nr:ATP-binding cassette domain-containing protein [Fibrobacteria bacterium]
MRKLRRKLKPDPEGEEVVGLDGIELLREERLVLKDIDLSIRRGQHWVLLGPNGSGKSSLLGVLQGLLWPIEGGIRVLGRRFGESDLSELRRLIGFVGNEIEPEFPAWQTVEEIAWSGGVGTVGLRFDKPTAADRLRARRLLRAAGIAHLTKRRFAFLSQGQRRMATIVRALMVKPGILILDEPAAGLDPVARENFLAKLAALMKTPSGPVILYVTHHVEEIIPSFTHVLMLRQGRVVSHGTVRESLNAENLGRVFGQAVELRKSGGRFGLRLAGRKAKRSGGKGRTRGVGDGALDKDSVGGRELNTEDSSYSTPDPRLRGAKRRTQGMSPYSRPKPGTLDRKTLGPRGSWSQG